MVRANFWGKSVWCGLFFLTVFRFPCPRKQKNKLVELFENQCSIFYVLCSTSGWGVAGWAGYYV